MGFTDIETCSVRSQMEHSNVRTSKPRSQGKIRPSGIRRLQAGHIGRSLIELASPATALASKVLPVPGGPAAFWHPAAEPAVVRRIFQEVDYLAQFVLGFVDAGNIGKVYASIGLDIDFSLALADRHQAAAKAATFRGAFADVPPQAKNKSTGITHDSRSRRKVLLIWPVKRTLYFSSYCAVS
jgi:hypothetical protein